MVFIVDVFAWYAAKLLAHVNMFLFLHEYVGQANIFHGLRFKKY
jgi:hypothetical protein